VRQHPPSDGATHISLNADLEIRGALHDVVEELEDFRGKIPKDTELRHDLDRVIGNVRNRRSSFE
jgi:hypothetical protein